MSVTVQSLVYDSNNSPAKLVQTVDRPIPPLAWTKPIILVIFFLLGLLGITVLIASFHFLYFADLRILKKYERSYSS
jgi:hypothetical protein